MKTTVKFKTKEIPFENPVNHYFLVHLTASLKLPVETIKLSLGSFLRLVLWLFVRYKPCVSFRLPSRLHFFRPRPEGRVWYNFIGNFWKFFFWQNISQLHHLLKVLRTDRNFIWPLSFGFLLDLVLNVSLYYLDNNVFCLSPFCMVWIIIAVSLLCTIKLSMAKIFI